VVVAAGGRGREEEAGGADLRRRQRWERQAEERRLCEVGFQQSAFIHTGIEMDGADLLDQ
jgi:hypothetical protein